MTADLSGIRSLLAGIRVRANNPFSPDSTRAQMDADRDQLLGIVERVEGVIARLDQEIVNSRIAESNAAEADMGAYLMSAQSETFAYKQARSWIRTAIKGDGE